MFVLSRFHVFVSALMRYNQLALRTYNNKRRKVRNRFDEG